MTHNRAFWKAFHSLVHPLSILAIVLLLLNDHWLRYAHPSWLTGKLGDFTWLLFAPFITALLLAWIIPKRWHKQTQWVGGLSIAFIGVWFATAKTIPVVHELTTRTLSAIVGWEGQLRLDATDLLTLPALLISVYIWRTASDEKVSLKPLAYVAFGLGILGTLASDGIRYSVYMDRGIHQFCQLNDDIAFKAMDTNFNDSTIITWDKSLYITDNGGLTWIKQFVENSYEADWENTEGELLDSLKCFDNTQIESNGKMFRWTNGKYIEISFDDGITWQTDYDLSILQQDIRDFHNYRNNSQFRHPDIQLGPLNAMVDENTGNVLFAMGWDGVLVREPSGIYHWVSVDKYRLDNLSTKSFLQFLFFQPFLMLALIFLIVVTSTAYIRRLSIQARKYLIGCGWLSWIAFVVLLLIDRNPPEHQMSLIIAIFSLPISIFLGIPLSIGAVWDILRNFRSVAIPIVLAGVGNGALFIFPFLLWTQGRVPRYVTAYAFAVFLTVLGLYASRIYLKRILPVLEPEKQKNEALEKSKTAQA